MELFPCFSFYPLYPPVEDVNMDYEKFQCFGQMPLTPDVLVLPSEMRYFVKVKKELNKQEIVAYK